MVGEGVLHECLHDMAVEKVLVLGRKSCGYSHSKLTEIIHQDFFDLFPIQEKLVGFNTCFFCAGVSSVGKNEQTFFNLTHTLTLHVAQTVSSLNEQMTFCYISGAGTDSSEKGRQMWARVKGRTENDLAKLPFRKVYNFRPGALTPTKGLKNTLSYYKYLGWLVPVVKVIAPNSISTLKQLGIAMIRAVKSDFNKQTIEVKDIIQLAG